MILAGRELIDHLVPTPLLFSFFECSTFLQYCFYDRVLFLKAHGQCLHYCLMIFSFIIFFHFISFHFISFHFISFRFVSFRFVLFRFVSFRFVSFHYFFHLVILSTCIISYIFLEVSEQPKQSYPTMILAGHSVLFHCTSAVQSDNFRKLDLLLGKDLVVTSYCPVADLVSTYISLT